MRRRNAQLIGARRQPREAVLAVAECVVRAAGVHDIGARQDRGGVRGRAVVTEHVRCRTVAVDQRDRHAVDRLSGARHEYAADRIEHCARLSVIGGVRCIDISCRQRHVQPAADRTIVRDGRPCNGIDITRERAAVGARFHQTQRFGVAGVGGERHQNGLAHRGIRVGIRIDHFDEHRCTGFEYRRAVQTRPCPALPTVRRTTPSASARLRTDLTDLQRRCIAWRPLRWHRAPLTTAPPRE